MFKNGVWYKSNRMNIYGLFDGRYTYFKCREELEKDVKLEVYDFVCDFENPKIIDFFKKDESIQEYREISQEEIDEDIKYLALLFI